MAYIDSKPGNGRSAAIGAVVALHAAAIYALVTGLGVDYIKEQFVVLKARNIPALPEPTPPPPPQPREQKQPRDSVVEVPKTEFTIPVTDDSFTVAPTPDLPKLPDVFPTDVTDYVKPPAPPAPQPSFAPKSAVPRGSPAGWVSTDDYPSRDLRQGNQGRVGFSLVIGTDGRVKSCVVTQSSGHPGLDGATCKLVTKRAKFTPAKDTSGAKTTGAYTNTVVWTIPN
jgi:protein TonB